MSRSASAADTPVSAGEAARLFDAFSECPVLLLAVSGGPDSTALLVLAARWRKARKRGPKLVAVTIDHGLRPEAKAEARAVAKLARSLGVTHRTVQWAGRKPKTGWQQAAREARYRLLAGEARKAGAPCVVTAHTLDDQAETVLLRLIGGSGVSGLAAMAAGASYPLPEEGELQLARPLLGVPKARLVATLKTAQVSYAADPSNSDPRFTRARLRAAMPLLSHEGLTPERLTRFARRMRRADDALARAAFEASAVVSSGPWSPDGPITLYARRFGDLPAEIALRLLGAAIGQVGNEGPVELGKLEELCDALAAAAAQSRQKRASARFRRTLAGAMVTLDGHQLRVERAPARRASKRP